VRTGQVNNRSLGDLLPALKVISQVRVRNGGLGVSLFDVTRQSVIFEQNDVVDLDWPQLRGALTKADPNKIDARSLQRRDQNAQFFVDQMRQRMGVAKTSPGTSKGKEPVRVGIVLSGPMAFESGQNLQPIEPASDPDRKVFYIRYHSDPVVQNQQPVMDPLRSGRRGGLNFPLALPPMQEPIDALEPLVKPLQPRLFDVYTPEQFRKALSTLLDEVSRM
jgi:hypothetical protein